MEKNIKEKTKFATAALVLGIIGVSLSLIPIINNAAFILGVLALIFAIVALAKKKSIATAIIALVLAVAAMGITVVAQKSLSDSIDKAGKELNKSMDDISGKNTDDILKNDVQVDLGKFTIKDGEYLQESEMKVTVKNKMSEKKSFSIKIEAVDTSGQRITEDTVYANGLGAGQSQTFEAFKFVSSDKYDSLKSATFKIFEVSKIN